MCDVYAKLFVECMKTPIKEDKCKQEFESWDQCYKNAYLKEFIKVNTMVFGFHTLYNVKINHTSYQRYTYNILN